MPYEPMGLLDEIGSRPMERSRGCSAWSVCAGLAMVATVGVFAVGAFGNQMQEPQGLVARTVPSEGAETRVDALLSSLDASGGDGGGSGGDASGAGKAAEPSEAAVRTAGAKLAYYKQHDEQRNEGYRPSESREGEAERRSRPQPPQSAPGTQRLPIGAREQQRRAEEELRRRARKQRLAQQSQQPQARPQPPAAAAQRQPQRPAGRFQAHAKRAPLVVDGREYERTLWEAARLGVVAVVEDMVRDDPSKIDAEDDIGNTPLHYACNEGHVAVAEVLLARGANVNAKGSGNNWTPLHSAVYARHKDVVRLLLARGADVNAVTTTSWTPMHSAAAEGTVPVLDMLVGAGADLNPKNFSGKTPLYLAAGAEHFGAVKFLLEKGADATVVASDGTTATDAALAAGASRISSYIQDWQKALAERRDAGM